MIYTIVLSILIFLFIYSGWTYSGGKSGTMIWIGGSFTLAGITGLIGIILILSLAIYFILKRRVFPKE